MYIQIFKNKDMTNEFEIDDIYYEKIVKGLDKALTDLCIKIDSITEKDVPIYLLQRYSPQEAVRKYIENDIGQRISIIRHVSLSITKDLLKVREEWLTEQGLNDAFVRYCGFSLIKQSFEGAVYNNVVNAFYSYDDFDNNDSKSETKNNTNEGWYMP